jgi:glycosyltransferase involved in cell wall biosynthesis
VKVSGFTFVRNAIQLDYPVIEAITSILPLCDEFIVAVGKSDDGTLELIQSIPSDKIRIIETVWDDTLREGGKVLAVETNKAFHAVSKDCDWAFYIQADEIIHEKFLPVIHQTMLKFRDAPEVEGLLLKYLHFYGSYDYIGDSRKWYRHEIRIIRNNKEQITSYKDAQGFRKYDNSKLRVKRVDAFVYHYGWVKHPVHQQKKQQTFHKYWHDNDWMEKNIPKTVEFDYSDIDSLRRFTGDHPSVMQQRIAQSNWVFEHDITRKNYGLKKRVLMGIEKYTGWRVGEYKNYKVI